MARLKFILEYGRYTVRGWQVQKNARTRFKEKINAAIAKFFGTHHFEFYGSGRTDAGVHGITANSAPEIKTMLAPENHAG